MRKKTGKIISTYLAAVILATSVTYGYAPVIPEAIERGSPSMAQRATQSMATPSVATDSEASVIFKRLKPKTVPSWYKNSGRFYQFTDRDKKIQFRTYGRLEEEEPQWFYADESGAPPVEGPQRIDLEWEDLNLAPYRYESILPSKRVLEELSQLLFKNKKEIFNLKKEVMKDPGFGRNYDGTRYDVWRFYDEESARVFYYLYGHIKNVSCSEDMWYRVLETGEVLEDEDQKNISLLINPASSTYKTYSLWSNDRDYADVTYEYVNGKSNLTFELNSWGGSSLNCIVPVFSGISENSFYHKGGTSGSTGGWTGTFETLQYDYGRNYVNLKFINITGSLPSFKLYDDVTDDGEWKWNKNMNIGPFNVSDYVKKGHGDVAGHSYSWTTNTNATCTSSGLRTGTCECGDMKTESISALGHGWGGSYTRIPAACTSSGTTSQSCTRCAAVQDVGTISPLGHAWPGSYTTTANNGTYYKNCTRCSARLETKYNPYTITYYGNGNTGGSTSESNHIYNTAKSLTSNGFAKQYHTFDNWNTRADGNGTKYTNGQSVNNLTAVYNGNVDLYAQWRRSSSLVTYQDWNGTTLKNQEVAVGGAASPPGNPVRTGYTFTGWDKTSNNIQDHTTIHAQYAMNSYQLSLNGNGGTIGGSFKKDHSILYNNMFDDALKQGKNEAVREGYSFDGWYTQPSGGTACSENGNRMPAAPVTIYAHWKPNTYTVRFDSSHDRWTGGIFEGPHTFDTMLGPLPSPSVYGWKLLNWRTGKNGAGEAVTERSMVEPRDVTYYGEWKPADYNIFYKSEADQPSGKSIQMFSAVQVYDQALETLPEPEEPGYTFTGWYDGASKIGPETIFCPVSNAEGYTYQAGWRANTYHVRLLGNHYGCAPVTAAFDKVYNTKLGTLPRPEAPGYTFQGWFAKDGTEVTEESFVEPYDTDYQARWEANTYVIRFDKNLYAIDKKPEDKKATYDEVLGELPILNTEGYTFIGWYTEKEGGEQVTEMTSVPLKDTTYYAHWLNNTYTLKLMTENAVNPVKEMLVAYDRKIGELPEPQLEDFTFCGWYLFPYTETCREGILADCARPGKEEEIVENTVYQTATSSNAYAYFDLVFQEEEGNRNRRGGKDQTLGTEDDNFYFNGADRIPGTSDDYKIYPGPDGTFETEDDSYLYQGFPVYPGPDCIFGTMDDYMDLENGTNIRPGESEIWDDQTNFTVNNGYDQKPGTKDDWIWDREELNTMRSPGPDQIFYTPDDEIYWIGEDGEPGSGDEEKISPGQDQISPSQDDFIDNKDKTNRRPGSDGIWGTKEDQQWWNGPDGIPGNQDDELIHKGMDGEYRTSDDFVDNKDGTNHRPGSEGKWGTGDDEQWWNGADGIPGTEDDRLIHNGLDGSLGTEDDFADKEDGTNRRPGSDGKWGTEDDELWWNGPDGIPGNEDDKLIHKGMDGIYETGDDFTDTEDGTNRRPGSDGKWGTEDDELWWNGPDGIPGNEDDKLIHKGMDGVYGTADDFIDKKDGTNLRFGFDEKWGTEDDEIWLNGPDGIPGNEDDRRPTSSSGNERTASSASSGAWIYNESEKVWEYQYTTGKKISSGWAYLIYKGMSNWYHFDVQGHMQTGWFRDVDQRWYYLHPVSDGTMGHMYTGWSQIDGKWYYFNKEEKLKGSLYTDTQTPDGFLVDQNGIWIQPKEEGSC